MIFVMTGLSAAHFFTQAVATPLENGETVIRHHMDHSHSMTGF